MRVKAMMLMELFWMSAEDLEYQVNDRMSFQRLLRLELQHEVPDSTTIRLFVEHITEAQAKEDLYVICHARLSAAHLVVNQGKIIDASVVNAPIQNNKRGDHEIVGNGEVPANWSVRKRAQKDMDVKWAKKNSRYYHGYKNHVKVDSGWKLIKHYLGTAASVTDAEMALDLMDERNQGMDFYPGKGYNWQDVKAGIVLAKMNDRTHKKARRNKPLTAQEEERNKELSRTHVRVEHVFGSMNKQLHGISVYYIGLVRASVSHRPLQPVLHMLRSLHPIPAQSPWESCDPLGRESLKTGEKASILTRETSVQMDGAIKWDTSYHT